MVLLTRLTFIGKFYFGLGQLGDRQDNCLPSRFPQDNPLSNGLENGIPVAWRWFLKALEREIPRLFLRHECH